MIRRIQVLNYRCLRYVDVTLDLFHVFSGPSGSGKSTLLDAVAILSDLVRDGPEAVVSRRAEDFRDLAWGRPEDNPRFEVAADFEIPRDLGRKSPGGGDFRQFRYEVALHDPGTGPGIEFERGVLMPGAVDQASPQEPLFADPPLPPPSIPSAGRRRGSKTVFSKSATGNDSFNVESSPQGSKGWSVRITLGRGRSTLANLPESSDSFPAATYIRDLLTRHVHSMAFDPAKLRRSSPPGLPAESLAPDGSNLAAAVARFRQADANGFSDWVAELQRAVPNLGNVLVTERQSDRHACLTIRETTGVDVPIRAISNGILRLMAITLFSRLPATRGLWLVRNEADGLGSPCDVVAFKSLSGSAPAQVLVATRSPGFASNAKASERFHCTRNEEGVANIVRGDALGDPETRDSATLPLPDSGD